jgi:uncharacterized protein YndB with AHSA1/START domain
MNDTKTIVVTYDLAQPPAAVWRALTEPALLARWLMENDIAPVVGHRFTMRAQPMPGWDGVVACEVLAVEPERLLRYSWRGGSPEHRIDTTVTWTLTPSPTGGTQLRLEHAGFRPADAMAFDGLSKGWAGRVGDRMKDVLATM